MVENIHVEYLELGRVPSENNPCNHLQALNRSFWKKVQFWGMFGTSNFMSGKSFGVYRTNFV